MLRSRINISAVRRPPLHSSPVSRIACASTLPARVRVYTSPSAPRPAPSAAVDLLPDDYEPAVMYNTRAKPEAEPHRFDPFPRTEHVHVPNPLPMDVHPPANSIQHDLYKPTATLDIISMLSICSHRPEFVPRAYKIFTQLLADAKAGLAHVPDTEVWANVIRGVAELGKPHERPVMENNAGIWRRRATKLVEDWEQHQGVDPGTPALDEDGIRVYRAWFAGLTKVGAPLDPILPYLEHPKVGVTALVGGMSRDDLDKALEQVSAFAAKNARTSVEAEVSEIQGLERQKREIQEREVIPEVAPVLETAKKPKRALSAELNKLDKEPQGPRARFTITNLRDTLQHIHTPLTAYNRQMQLEKASYMAAEAELKHAAKQLEEFKDVKDAQRLKRDHLQAYMHRWLAALTDYLEKDIEAMSARVFGNEKAMMDTAPPRWTAASKLKDSTMLLYLTVMPAKKMALITILEVMRMVGSGGIIDGMKTLRGLTAVGKAIEAEYRAETIRTVAGQDSVFWQRTIDSQTQKPSRANVEQVWNELGRAVKGRSTSQATNELGSGVEGSSTSQATNDLGSGVNGSSTSQLTKVMRSVWTPPWTQMIQMSLGAHIIEGLINTAKVTRIGTDPDGTEVAEEQPAFSHGYEYVRGKKQGVIRVNPVVAARLASDSVRQVIHPKNLPMLVPPRQWRRWNDGGYLATPVQAMRFKDSIEQVNYLREASRKQLLDPVFHGLDVLSSTPWRINRKVFDVILEAWNSGDGIGAIPPTAEKCKYNFPEKPDPRDNDPQKRSIYVEKLKAALVQQRKDHGERCKYNYNLEIARSYLNDVFYIPHNMDFRGRAYPIPPHLSPVGDDLCRGLLTFGEKKPLGATGLKWLKIQLANVYGFDKASFEERIRFAEEHEADIFDAADKALDGNRWWLKAEDPWQCLATCFELAEALRSPDPTKYESSLPVHQDGTCNGMQHYAALGGDVRGAQAVNLEKGDRPADIYSTVLELVNERIKEDQKNNVPISLILKAPLTRKIIKQTVMTTVYGVTFVGARDQIARQLQHRDDIPFEDLYPVSSYIAKKVLMSIGDLFAGARQIQDWFTMSARLIARSVPPDRIGEAVKYEISPRTKKKVSRLSRELMTSVVWTTPLGLPVVQPYRKEARKQVMTSLQTVYIHDPNAPTEVNPHKQSTAFPPNFIHSLDATHMLLTATRCNQSNLMFASVHDSYWTHAATVEPMSEVIRDTFVMLHSQNLVGELREEFLERYGDNLIPITNAKLIAQASERRKAQLTVLKGKRGPKAKADAAAAAADSAAAVDEVAADSAADAAEAEAALAASHEDMDVDELDPFDFDTPESKKDEAIELDAAELDSLTEGNEIQVIKQGDFKFVRFRDVLPAAPERGDWKVERIRESEYFFS